MPHSAPPMALTGGSWLCRVGRRARWAWSNCKPGDTNRWSTLPVSHAGLISLARYAFVGLSQVRGGACSVASRSPERLVDPAKRMCGVCVVDLRSGEVVAWLQFMDGVQEVFAVQVVPRRCQT